MSYLVDTDVVIWYLRRRAAERALLDGLAPQGLAVSLITYGEVFEGIYFGRDPQADEHAFRSFLSAVRVLPLDESIMERFARLRGQLRRGGLIISDPDLLIAATALHHTLMLLTGNVQHFARVPGLEILPPPGAPTG